MDTEEAKLETPEMEAVDEDENEEDEQIDSDDERPDDCPSFRDGLLPRYIKMVENAKTELKILQSEQNQSAIQNKITAKINQEWSSVLSLSDLKKKTIQQSIQEPLKSKL
jgi:hypothetical protein